MNHVMAPSTGKILAGISLTLHDSTDRTEKMWVAKPPLIGEARFPEATGSTPREALDKLLDLISHTTGTVEEVCDIEFPFEGEHH
jgi:hypothetical protein